MVEVEGGCLLSGIVVGGNVRIGGLEIAPAAPESLCLNNARVGGIISLVPFGASAAPAAAGGHAHGRRSRLPGSMSAFGATCQAMVMKSIDIDGECNLSGLRVATSLESTGNVFGAGLNMDHLDCGQVVTIRSCKVAGPLTFGGSKIDAQLSLGDAQLGEVLFNGASIGSLWIGTHGPVECTRIYATSSRFSSYVKMSRLVVRGAGGEAGSAALAGSGMIEFEHCHFNGLFTTWPVLGVPEIDGWQPNNFVKIEKGFSFTDCDVGGHLSLTRLRAGSTKSGEAGFIRLDRTRLRGPLFISSPLAIARRRQVPERTRQGARKIVESGKESAYRARTGCLSIREFTASAIELSGIDLVASGSADQAGTDNGSLLGDRLEVAGRLETYVVELNPGLPEGRRLARANIGGALRLRAARIGELHLDGDSFRQRHGCLASSNGVVLELADIGLLRVPRMETSSEPDLNGFPVPLDLSGVTVRNWNFHEDVESERRAKASDYLDFLDNDEGLHREVYRSVAKSLRDAGQDDDAEQVLYAEEYRAHWESHRSPALARSMWPIREPAWWFLGFGPAPRIRGRRGKPWIRLGRLFEPFDRFFLQYRRNTINLLYLILILFTVSAVFVSSNASNFELSPAARLVLKSEGGKSAGLATGIEFQTDGLNVGPDPKRWGLGNTLWMTMRYHVPIVSMTFEDEYVASNDNRLRFRLPLGNPRPRSAGENPGEILFSAEDWFALMSIFNWIMWPLLLTFALRRALRSD